MNEALKEKQVGKYTVKVYFDNLAENPRTLYDNLSTMICFHRRYDLGDKHNMDIDEAQEFFKRKDIIALPLFLYEHSGITISTSAFSCQWDSGQVGFIYVEKEKIREEWKVKRISKKLHDRIVEIMQAEISEYDDYLTGQVFYYTVENENGEHIDSCGGYYGNTEDPLADGVSIAKWHIQEDIKKHSQQVKQWIKNKVPLIYRQPCPIVS